MLSAEHGLLDGHGGGAQREQKSRVGDFSRSPGGARGVGLGVGQRGGKNGNVLENG